jgi:glyoxylase-like metal-dependent hydrolase (beta-lactamase superfamily II)
VVNGKTVPTFSNARYVVRRGELEHARHPTERDRASYFPENFEPIAESGQWWLVDQDCEVAPGVEMIRMPGHNEDIMGVRLTGGGQSVVFLTDLVPTSAHVPAPWIMGFDLYPMQTLANKKRWLTEIAKKGWLAVFVHDSKVRAARLREGEGGKLIAEAVSVD